jgi:hypothetical protein
VLDPQSLRVITETRSDHATALAGHFSSLSPDSLSRIGYWQQRPGDSVTFHAPSAEVLLSDAFVRDHCFSVVEGRRDRADQIGLAFGPAPGRYMNDIRGTMWIHSRTFALQSVEFRYTNVPPAQFSERNGGEVYFVRTPEGSWYVRQWYARMPQITKTGAPSGHVNASFNVPTVYRTIEEGGEVTPVGPMSSARKAFVTGVVLDSAGAPVGDAVVELAGTSFRTRTNLNGQFSLADVPPGRYRIIAPSDGYRRYGVPAAEQELELEASTADVSLKASNMRGLADRLCRGRGVASDADRSILRVILSDSVNAAPLARAALRARWTDYGPPVRGLRPVRSGAANASTDETGAAVFCSVAPNIAVQIELVLRGEQTQPLTVERLLPGTITVISLRTMMRPD